MQRKPRSLASRTVVLTHTSVVTPADEQSVDAAIAQHQFEIGLIERALARLVDHRLAGERIKLGNDVVAGLAADQDAAHRAAGADAVFRIAALDLVRRRIGQDPADGLRGCE